MQQLKKMLQADRIEGFFCYNCRHTDSANEDKRCLPYLALQGTLLLPCEKPHPASQPYTTGLLRRYYPPESWLKSLFYIFGIDCELFFDRGICNQTYQTSKKTILLIRDTPVALIPSTFQNVLHTFKFAIPCL